MDAIFEKILTQGSPLAVLVVVVFFFLRHIEKTREAAAAERKELVDRLNEQHKENLAAQANTKDALDKVSSAIHEVSLAIAKMMVAALVFCGCVQVSGTRHPDGTLTIATHRFLWASEGIDFRLTDTNGITTSLEVKKSSPSAEAMGAIAEGIAKGTAKGFSPLP